MNFKEIKIKEILKEFKDGDKNRSLNSLLKLIKGNPDELDLSLIYGKMCLEVNKLDEGKKDWKPNMILDDGGDLTALMQHFIMKMKL